jgi:predicted transcriptional regulator
MSIVEYAIMDDLQRVIVAAQKNRHKILEILTKDGERNNAEHLATSLKLNYKTTVFHLKALEDAGLIEGKFALDENVAIKCYYLTQKGKQIFSRLEGLK